MVGARADGGEHLVRLGGGEHEDQVLGRLLDHLEQRVERRRGDHVRLVDDEDAVAGAHRREVGAVAQLAGVVDAVVARGVHLGDVERAGTVRGERDAGLADAARVGCRTLLAVQRAGEDARAGRLAAAPRPGEEVGVVDPAGGQRRAQRIGDVLLTDHLGERRRPVPAVERQSHEPEATRTPRRRRRGDEGDPAHPPEPADPCCLPALGEFTGWTPRGVRGPV